MFESPGRQMATGTATCRARSTARRLGEALLRAVDALLLWRERGRQRAQLAMLSDDLLKDIGVSRLDAHVECRKWPWQS